MNARRLILSVLALTLGAMAFASVPALAAAPEKPEVSVEDTTAVVATPSTEVVLHGILDPGLVGEPGTYEMGEYEFLYKADATCTGGSVVPTPPGMSLGGGHEELPAETLTGLTANTKYTVCLQIKTAGGTTLSTPVAFTTALPPEKPVTKSPAASITATTATLEGTLNPSKEAETGWHFLYSTEPKCAEGASEAPGEEVKKVPAKTKEHLTVTELQPNKKYTFCLVATNSAGEAVQSGNEVTFETKPAPPKIESESAGPVPASEANPYPSAAHEIRLEGTVNPNNEATECHFQYQVEEPVLEAPTTVPCEPASFSASFPGQGVALNVGGLEEDKTYYYRVVAKNAAGETEGTEAEPIKEFKTALAPNTPEAAKPTEITAKTATLNAVLNPAGPRAKEPGSDEFVYRQSESECRYILSPEEAASIETKIAEARRLKDTAKKEELEAELKADRAKEAENKAAPAAAPPGLGEKEAAKAPVGELHPGAAYTYCLLVRNEAGEEVLGPAETFTTLPAAPKIVGESATSVTATEATLSAQIEPNGAETHYYFQYGTTESYGESTPLTKLEGSLIAADTAEAIAKPLQPNTTYHYHVVAENKVGGKTETKDGEDKTFTTSETPTTTETCPNKQQRAEQPFGLALPDCRAYEMVSPEETGGQDAVDSFEVSNARAAVSSENPAITYASKGSFGEPTGAADTDQFVSRRNVKEGRWETQAITPLFNPEGTTTESAFESTVFTPELTEGIAATDASLPGTGAPGTSNGEFDQYLADFATGSYRYLAHSGVKPDGASADLSRVLLENPSNETLFEGVDGTDVPVSVSNSGEEMEASTGSASQYKDSDAWHATSEDGSRVYFTTNGQLDVRVNVGVKAEPEPEREQSKMKDLGLPGEECLEPTKACTVEVDAAEEGAPGPGGGGRYWGASADGERVFFTDENKLTKDSTAESGAPDLYEYRIERGHLYGHLTDLTSESTVVNAGEHADVQGVVQISEDGSYVYFVANGVLTGEPNARGEKATAGTCVLQEDSVEGRGCNMYVSHDGITEFIDTLSEGHEAAFYDFVGGDKSDWNPGSESEGTLYAAGPEINTAVVNPSGTRLAFISERSLTGYDNKEAQHGECEEEIAGSGAHHETGACREIYLYDAETHGVVCASCNPTGARPSGPSSFASSLQFGSDQYRARNLLEDGTLFFNSSDALVPHAGDGRRNVYEYEYDHVNAISNVAGGDESFFLDASPSGEDVFFGSANKLLPQDTSDNVVVWDAREDGGFPVATAAPACTTAEACRAASPPTPGVFGSPPSATFSGPGNTTPVAPAVVTPKKRTAAELKAEKLAKALKTCRTKKNRQKRQACEKQARAKYGPTKPKTKKAKAKKSAHTNRRTH